MTLSKTVGAARTSATDIPPSSEPPAKFSSSRASSSWLFSAKPGRGHSLPGCNQRKRCNAIVDADVACFCYRSLSQQHAGTEVRTPLHGQHLTAACSTAVDCCSGGPLERQSKQPAMAAVFAATSSY